MPSNDSPAFDVLSASEYDLWEWAVERAGVENAATYIRDAAEAAVRARLMRCGGSDAGLAYGKLRKEYDALRGELDAAEQHVRILRESQAPEAEREPNELADAQRLLAIVMEQRAELTAELDALKQSRDTDLARARREGIREGLTQYADAPGCGLHHYSRTVQFRDQNYPAPKPAECRLSDGSVVGWNPSTKMFCASRPDWYCQTNDWRTLAMTVEDFATLKAFAATRTEGPMAAKRLLAEATPWQLRNDAAMARLIAEQDNELRKNAPFLLRLAALAEAVAIAEGTLVLRQTAESLEAADMKGATPEAHLYFCWEPPEQSLPAALSTLLPTEDTTDGR